VAVLRDGRYNVLLGATTGDGLPLDLFTTGNRAGWGSIREFLCATPERDDRLGVTEHIMCAA
jgi:hypothetical protein